MGYDNSYTGVNDSDKCPKCGAVKVFSALVCPSCGTNYATSRANNTANSTGMSYTNQPQNSNVGTINNFDPNATFSAYKKTLEGKENGQMYGNVENNDGTGAKGSDSVLANVAELDKPVELDPIAKKLQEMNQQNAGANTGSPVNRGPVPSIPNVGVPNQGAQYRNTGNQSIEY